MNLRYSASAGRNGSGMSVTIRANSLGVIRAGYRALSVAAASLMRRRTPATAARHLARGARVASPPLGALAPHRFPRPSS